MNTIKIDIADGIATLAIDMPGRPMNVITPELVRELGDVVEEVAGSEAIRGAILTSTKSSGFVAGADIKDMLGHLERGIDAAAAAALGEPLGKVLRRMETCGKPFAAALNGLALGGGLEIALACHFRVLADHSKAVVGLPEVAIGLLPAGGGTQRLPRLIGIEKALGPLLGGQHLSPEQALRLGIVNATAREADLLQVARQWIQASPKAVQPWDAKGFTIPGGAGPTAEHAGRTFAAGQALLAEKTQHNMPAPKAILSAVFEGTQMGFDAALRLERKYFGQLLAGPVARNLMRTLFINKGRCDKLSNRPSDVPKSKVTKLGVLGAGMMGAGIAYAAASGGIRVVLVDVSEQQANKGKDYARIVLEKKVTRGKSTREKADALLALIEPGTDFQALADCDVVVEAVFEKREVKADVTRRAAAVMRPDAVFGSNTSTLPITGLAEAFARPANFIGMHFFSPAERMPLVEVILGQRTSDETLARTLDFVQQLRKTPIVVKDSRGFFTSRTFGSFVKEGMAMLQEGIQPALIENAARQAGMPVGPLAITDEVSLEIQLKVYDQAVADGDAPRDEPALTIELLRKMVNQLSRPGKAGGGGFYDHPQGGKKTLWPQLSQVCPPASKQPEVDELKRRFLVIQALEGARCVEEGVIADPADADVGSILGIGYPAWTGGVLSYIEMVGLQAFVDQAARFAEAYGRRYEPSPWLRERASQNRLFHPPLTALE